MKKIRHKNIIKFYSYESDNENVYIIMEYAEKGSLADLIKKRIKIEEKLSKKIFAKIV